MKCGETPNWEELVSAENRGKLHAVLLAKSFWEMWSESDAPDDVESVGEPVPPEADDEKSRMERFFFGTRD